MRLLHFNESGGLTWSVFTSNIPPYAILSHTWDVDEVTFEDLLNGTGKSKAGSRKKILFCGEQAARDHLRYFWVDTCCIDKWNRVELSDAINFMFRWYRNAAKCYVFLSDVQTPAVEANLQQNTWEESFRKSRWFTRGWTLQELIAPASSLEQQIHEITGIPVKALRGHCLHDFSIDERMEWAKGRKTTQAEDCAYRLLGIFGITMLLSYGEGKESALNRLKKEVNDSFRKVDTTPFIVPFNQNFQFTGRESQLAELEKLFVTQTTKFAITGIGGIGKTQLALELAYRTRQKYKKCSVFWIPATDIESVHQAYTHIAQRLNISGWDDAKADVKRLVQLHLSKESAGQWLLIFDNADDISLWTTGSAIGSLMEYLPRSEQGRIVFTTSDRETAVRLASQNIIEVPEGDQGIARIMLKKCLINQSLTNEQREANLLLKELTYLPLAIVLAAAYINVNNITLKEYPTLFAKQEKEIIEALCEGFEDGSRYYPVATSWLVSFEQIRCRDKLAADYLSFMACIDRRDIPYSLLPRGPSRDKEIDAITTLKAYSIIIKRPAGQALDIHRLVHLIARNWLRKQDSMVQWTQVAIIRLLDMFSEDNHENRSKRRRLLPHANSTIKSGPIREGNKARATLARRCAIGLFHDGRYNEAELYLLEAVQFEEMVHGAEHPDTLTCMGNLAGTYYNQGRSKEAEELWLQVLEMEKRVLGAEHPDTLTSMGNLASTYINQGRWKEAEELLLQVMETRKRVLGAEHPDTLTSLGNLASTYTNQGRWTEAEELWLQVMETRKGVFGAEHPADTLTCMGNLASTYSSQGQWKEAEELGLQVMETRKRVLGAEHPDTLTSMGNLAFTWKTQGRDAKALKLLEECVQLQTRVLGIGRPDTTFFSAMLRKWRI